LAGLPRAPALRRPKLEPTTPQKTEYRKRLKKPGGHMQEEPRQVLEKKAC